MEIKPDGRDRESAGGPIGFEIERRGAKPFRFGSGGERNRSDPGFRFFHTYLFYNLAIYVIHELFLVCKLMYMCNVQNITSALLFH